MLISTLNVDPFKVIQYTNIPVENTKIVLSQSPPCCRARVMLPTASSMADTMPAYSLRWGSLMKL